MMAQSLYRINHCFVAGIVLLSLWACSGGSNGGQAGSSSSGTPTLELSGPGQNASLPVGPVKVSFTTQNFTIGQPGQPHLQFFVDNDPVVFEFYNGPTVNEDNGVLYKHAHTHFVHWANGSSFNMFGLTVGQHRVRLVLADASGTALSNPEATTTLTFTVLQPAQGEFSLQPVLSGLQVPVDMVVAPDGRLFYNELFTGKIRIIDPGPVWAVRAAPFYEFSDVKSPILNTGDDQNTGLLAVALDPNFGTNGYVYAYYTASGPDRNKVVRLTDLNGQGTSPTTIFDNIPAGRYHNGSDLQFGPDGKLYVITGDADQEALAQDLGFLGGKILRLNPDGSVPADNPIPGSPVYSYGHRNGVGITFHPHTGHLWYAENGPFDSDEINRVVAGGNYGWPIVKGIANDPRFIDPIAVYYPPPCTICTIGPTGIIGVREDSIYPAEYHQNLLFLDFDFGQIHRLVLSGADFTERGSASVAYGGGQGPLLGIVQGPDRYVYVSNFDTIFRVVKN